MGLENAISMEPVKEKLRNLKEYMPGEDQTIYDFGEFLADRLNSIVVPRGFYLATELALCDLRAGIGRFGRHQVKSSLVGYSPVIYDRIGIYIPNIAKAVCPEDFAERVKQISEASNA